MELVLSWDIGIKNLSYCLLQKGGDIDEESKTKQGYYIKDWGLINLYDDEIKVNYCKCMTKKNKVCNKKATFSFNEEFYCKTHKTENSSLIKKPKKSKRSPFEYAKRIKEALHSHNNLLEAHTVIIENQPSQLNPVMKSVQMLLFSYYSYYFGTDKAPNMKLVTNINAKQKEKLPLKDPDWDTSENKIRHEQFKNKSKDPYKRRKNICFEYAKLCLQNAPEYLGYLDNHSKKDDLTDCFLQATDWFLRN